MSADRDAGCILCAIVAGREPSRRIMGNEAAVALLDINPAADGHTLVVPKDQVADIWVLTEDLASGVWAMTLDVAHRLRDILRPDGLTLFQANERAGWQDVFHFLIHVVPRWKGDSLIRPWGLAPGDPSDLDEIAREASNVGSDAGMRPASA